MLATRLTLVCHGRTAAQKFARFALDEPLLEPGAVAMLPPPWQLLSAPELRARQTAAQFGCAPTLEPALRDCDMGRWAGLPIKQLQRDEAPALECWLSDSSSAAHGGESIAMLCHRVGTWMDSLTTRPGHWLAVSHPQVVRAALVHALQGPPGAFTLIDVEPLARIHLQFNGRWRLRLPAPGEE